MKLSEKKLNIKSILIITIILPVFVIAVSSIAIVITAKSVQPGAVLDTSLLKEEGLPLPSSQQEAFDFVKKNITSAVNSNTIKYKDSTSVGIESLVCDNKSVEEIFNFAKGSLCSHLSGFFETAEIRYGENAKELTSLLPEKKPDSFEASSENGIITVELIYTKVYGNMYFIGADTAAVKSFSKENEGVFSSINEKMIPEQIKYTLRYDESRGCAVAFIIERAYNYSSHIAFVNTLSDIGTTPLSFRVAFTRSFEISAAGIFIEEDVLTLDKNGYDTLTVTPYTQADLSAEEFSLTFTSSDESVATVDENGQVTAIKLSTKPVVITVELEYLGKTFTDSCTVYVAQSVTAVNLDTNKVTLKKGETHNITATLKPDDATITELGYISSDPSVAKVSENGEITATGIGTAVITVYSPESFVAAECTVTVTE